MLTDAMYIRGGASVVRLTFVHVCCFGNHLVLHMTILTFADPACHANRTVESVLWRQEPACLRVPKW